jgi:hypothetical protein
MGTFEKISDCIINFFMMISAISISILLITMLCILYTTPKEKIKSILEKPRQCNMIKNN